MNSSSKQNTQNQEKGQKIVYEARLYLPLKMQITTGQNLTAHYRLQIYSCLSSTALSEA